MAAAILEEWKEQLQAGEREITQSSRRETLRKGAVKESVKDASGRLLNHGVDRIATICSIPSIAQGYSSNPDEQGSAYGDDHGETPLMVEVSAEDVAPAVGEFMEQAAAQNEAAGGTVPILTMQDISRLSHSFRSRMFRRRSGRWWC